MTLRQLLELTAQSRVEPVQYRTRIHGLPIGIQAPRGSIREIKDDNGNTVFKKHQYSDYGEISHTRGRDKDPIDVMVGPLKDQAKEVYVIHMRDLNVKSGKEDEDKVMIGFQSADAAREAFCLQYPRDFIQSMTVLPVKEFKKRLASTQIPHTHNMLHARRAK